MDGGGSEAAATQAQDYGGQGYEEAWAGETEADAEGERAEIAAGDGWDGQADVDGQADADGEADADAVAGVEGDGETYGEDAGQEAGDDATQQGYAGDEAAAAATAGNYSYDDMESFERAAREEVWAEDVAEAAAEAADEGADDDEAHNGVADGAMWDDTQAYDADPNAFAPMSDTTDVDDGAAYPDDAAGGAADVDGGGAGPASHGAAVKYEYGDVDVAQAAAAPVKREREVSPVHPAGLRSPPSAWAAGLKRPKVEPSTGAAAAVRPWEVLDLTDDDAVRSERGACDEDQAGAPRSQLARLRSRTHAAHSWQPAAPLAGAEGSAESESQYTLPPPGQVPQVEVISLDDDDDDEDPIPAADDEDADELTVNEREIFFAEMLTRIVGLKQYRGNVPREREKLRLVRERNNTYDKQAIRVDTWAHEPLGLILHEHSAVLAPLIDLGNIRLRAFSVPTKTPSPHFAPVLLYFYGPPHYERPVLDQILRSRIELRWTRLGALQRQQQLAQQQQQLAQQQQRLQLQQQQRWAMLQRAGQGQYRLPSAAAAAGTVGAPPLLFPTAASVQAAATNAPAGQLAQFHQQQLLLQQQQRLQMMQRPLTPQQVYAWRQANQAAAHAAAMAYQQQQAALHHSRLLSAEAQAVPANKMMETLFQRLQEHQSKLPEAAQPRHILTPLLPYQRQGLAWLTSREEVGPPTAGKSVLFWEFLEGENVYYNRATHTKIPSEPFIARGGILADDMGLGKTIQVISMIVNDLDEGREARMAAEDEALALGNDPPPKSTLIVCPLSVVGNWVKQFDTHVARGAVSVYVYHGAMRTTDTNELQSHDVIITTYAILASEILDNSKATGDQAGALQRIHWLRVVLDEAHTIKSRRTKQSTAACQLKAERRWCLTGTPIQNELDDLFSLVKFLRMAPFWDHYWWTKVFARPIRENKAQGFEMMQELLKDISLRRVKDMKINGRPLLELPARNVYLKRIKFLPEEQKIYDALDAASKKIFQEYVKSNTLSANVAHVLVILTRLRQLCDHPSLFMTDRDLDDALSHPAAFLQGEHPPTAESATSSDPTRDELLTLLRDNEIEDCSYCTETMRVPSVTPCGHLFCRSCIEHLCEQGGVCSVCQRPVKMAQVLSGPDMVDDGDDGWEAPAAAGTAARPAPAALAVAPVVAAIAARGRARTSTTERYRPSAKVLALLEFLDATRAKDRRLKTVVFSQWTTMLNIIETFLQERDYGFARLDGQMVRKNREDAMTRFETDPNCTVFMISLKCGSLGLNLTAASQVILMDPWWNPATEDQAIDRVHRIGQLRPVNVVRFVVDSSVEQRVVALQDRKRKLMEQAFGRGTNASREQRVEDLKLLFT